MHYLIFTPYEPRHKKTGLRDFRLGPTQSDTNRAEPTQKMVRGLKFQILKEEGLYYLCSENKDVDQLRSYCTADLRLCFRICKSQVFS